MTSASLELQKAINEKLAASNDLPPIYDGIRSTARFPYIVLGRDKVFYPDNQSHHQSHIFVYSQAFSIVEVKLYLNYLLELLDGKNLELEGHKIILSQVRTTESLRLSDGKTFRGELVLETTIEPNVQPNN